MTEHKSVFDYSFEEELKPRRWPAIVNEGKMKQ
ncbi:hypothetical protein J2T02_003584 [Chitinophaga terrae (ex Kim and Jung 2007)]|nr:hypothetical protein [Chitinophaga terrae (ex Kim and Jung 2007)]